MQWQSDYLVLEALLSQLVIDVVTRFSLTVGDLQQPA